MFIMGLLFLCWEASGSVLAHLNKQRFTKVDAAEIAGLLDSAASSIISHRVYLWMPASFVWLLWHMQVYNPLHTGTVYDYLYLQWYVFT